MEAAAREEAKRQAVLKAAEERKRKQELEAAALANAQAEVQTKADATATTASVSASELVMKRVEWQKWREVMGTVKAQVIENVKQDDAVRRGLRRSKNTITMRIGQVVNTRESIVKIVSVPCLALRYSDRADAACFATRRKTLISIFALNSLHDPHPLRLSHSHPNFPSRTYTCFRTSPNP